MVIISIPAIAYIILGNNKVQNNISYYLIEELSNNLNSVVTIESVKYSIFKKATINNLYIEDLNGDTLVYSKKVKLNIKNLNLNKRSANIKYLSFEDCHFYLFSDSANEINLQFIIDKLRPKDTTKTPWDIYIKTIEMANSIFRYNKPKNVKKRDGVNFSDLEFNKLNIELNKFHKHYDTVSFYINNLEFIDKSGFYVQNFQSNFTIHKKFLHFDNTFIQAANSQIEADKIHLNFNSTKNLKYIISKVNLDLDITKSAISFIDIAYFAPKTKNYPKDFKLKGEIYGRINNLKGKDILINFSKSSILHANFHLDGLPEIKKSFLYLDVKDFYTNTDDIDLLEIPIKNDATLKLSETLKKFGNINYNGNFTGFYDDFVAYGNISTDMGNITTDISLSPGLDKYLGFNGEILADNFNIGELVNAKNHIGQLSLNAKVDGHTSAGGKIDAYVDGKAYNFLANNYLYENIDFNGQLTNKTFDGSVKIEDPNIKFQFSGRVDFAKEIPVFDFTAYASNINLLALNIDKSANNSIASFVLQSNIIGNSIDNVDGEINIFNSTFYRNNKRLEINNLTLKAISEIYSKKLLLRSDYIDADIEGRYYFADIISSLKTELAKYIPSLTQNECKSVNYNDTINNFQYKIFCKQLKPITNFFIPDVYISENSFFRGQYHPRGDNITLNSYIDKLKIKRNVISSLSIKTTTDNSKINFNVDTKDIIVNDDFKINNFQCRAEGINDSINIKNQWNNLDTVLNSGNLTADILFESNSSNCKPWIELFIHPSEVIVNDSTWNLSDATIIIDTTSIKILKQVKFIHNNRILTIDGTLSDKKDDKFNIVLNDIDIKKINSLVNLNSINFNGYMYGNATISDIYNDPLFISDVKIESFEINNEKLGQFNINSEWDNRNRVVNIKGTSKKGRIENIDIKGVYTPTGKLLDFEIELKKLKMNLLNPLFTDIFSDIRGMASGELSLAGTTKKPVMNGELNVQKASFTIDYIKTRYNFTHNIKFEDNNIQLPEIRLFDPKGNFATVSGIISNEHFKDWAINLNIEANDLMCLNTTEDDNSTFFGEVYSSGIVNISGPTNNIVFDISAKSSPGTVFYIPLYEQGDISENDFLLFSNELTIKDTTNKFKRDYTIDLSGIQLNMDLEVTNDAEAQLIFDSKIGDIIKSRGEGNLKLEINKFGDFLIFGEYNIEKGDYLFTLQNVINKRFYVKPGGQIIFNGDPYEAITTIEAGYNLKANLDNLLVDQIENSKRFPIECLVYMTGQLSNPDIKLDIELLESDEETIILFDRALNKGSDLNLSSNNELNKQFLSLMVLNQFMPSGSGITETTSMLYSKGASVTTSELLSNQLSNWLSQINDNWDIGFNYRYDSDLSQQQMEVALSTQLLNDRMTINGNVDLAGNNTTTSNMIGDFDINYKLNKSGRLRLKAYHKTHNRLDLVNLSPHTQGIGLFYREEFNSFDELLKYYWASTFAKDTLSR